MLSSTSFTGLGYKKRFLATIHHLHETDMKSCEHHQKPNIDAQHTKYRSEKMKLYRTP